MWCIFHLLTNQDDLTHAPGPFTIWSSSRYAVTQIHTWTLFSHIWFLCGINSRHPWQRPHQWRPWSQACNELCKPHPVFSQHTLIKLILTCTILPTQCALAPLTWCTMYIVKYTKKKKKKHQYEFNNCTGQRGDRSYQNVKTNQTQLIISIKRWVFPRQQRLLKRNDESTNVNAFTNILLLKVKINSQPHEQCHI